MSTVQGSEALTVTNLSLVSHPRSQISMQPHELCVIKSHRGILLPAGGVKLSPQLVIGADQ